MDQLINLSVSQSINWSQSAVRVSQSVSPSLPQSVRPSSFRRQSLARPLSIHHSVSKPVSQFLLDPSSLGCEGFHNKLVAQVSRV